MSIVPTVMRCVYCGLVTDRPCGFLSVALGCTRGYHPPTTPEPRP